jgi:hypothetical protein
MGFVPTNLIEFFINGYAMNIVETGAVNKLPPPNLLHEISRMTGRDCAHV